MTFNHLKKYKYSYFMITLTVVLIATIIVISDLHSMQNNNTVIINMTTQQFKFVPSRITVKYGSHVQLNIKSLDVTHGFQIDQLNVINVPTPPGQTTIIKFVANKRGVFKFYCTVFCGTGHINHWGLLTVE